MGFMCFVVFFFSFGSKLIGKNIILENLFSLEKLHRLKKYLLPTKTLMKTNTVFCSMVTQKPVISFCSTLKIIVKLENQSSTWMNLYLHLNITEIQVFKENKGLRAVQGAKRLQVTAGIERMIHKLIGKKQLNHEEILKVCVFLCCRRRNCTEGPERARHESSTPPWQCIFYSRHRGRLQAQSCLV